MPNLAIPDTGLQLESPSNPPAALPMQAFGLVLNDDVIEDMIRCFRDGENLELCLGNAPVSSGAPFCCPPLNAGARRKLGGSPGFPWSLNCLCSSLWLLAS